MSPFVSVRRQQFRRYFQPSRVVIAVLPAPMPSGVNLLAVSFDMYCSYRPVMMAIAVHRVNVSYDLVGGAAEYVLAVPGKSLAEETLQCGLQSMHSVDKVSELGIRLCDSELVATPGLADAIANIELVREQVVETGDHVLLIGKVVAFRVNQDRGEPPLLSIGPDTRGYELLARKGIHRLGVVAGW
jgi:flavin reductase (DIM6/NTAB) family NADH-FMN oxidoreductase RutF